MLPKAEVGEIPFAHVSRRDAWPVVGMPRIELGLHAPHACVLPLYDIPG